MNTQQIARLAEQADTAGEPGRSHQLQKLKQQVAQQISRSLQLDAGDLPGLHNLRGILYALLGDEVAAEADLRVAVARQPSGPVALYNLGVVLMSAKDWAQAEKALFDSLCYMPAGVVRSFAAHGHDLARVMQGKTVPACSAGNIVVSVPADLPIHAERLWAGVLSYASAEVQSVPRVTSACGYKDRVAFGLGMPYAVDGGETLGSSAPARVLRVLESAGYATHPVYGPSMDANQACQVVAKASARGLCVEAWAFTMRMPGGDLTPPELAPLQAGLALRVGDEDPRDCAEAALSALAAAAAACKVELWSPSLMRMARNDLGAARHRKHARLRGHEV